MITLNTSISNTNQRCQRNTNPSFKGSMPQKSAFLNPFKKGFDNLTNGIAKFYTGPYYSSKVANWLSHRDDIGHIVEHMQAIGSYIISGMYMIQTLRNKDMDEDRRRTLAINQGLTLVASTAIAYFVSRKIEKFWWNKNVSMKYAADKRGISVEQLEKDFEQHKKDTKERYFRNHADDITLKNIDIKKMKKIYQKEHKTLDNFDKYLDDLISNKSTELELKKFKTPNLIHFAEEGLKNKNLAGKLKGLDVLKSLIVFGSVYRFFGPVAVTPVATWLGNHLTGASKKAKEQKQEAKPEANLVETQPKDDKLAAYSVFKRPDIAKFLGNNINE